MRAASPVVKRACLWLCIVACCALAGNARFAAAASIYATGQNVQGQLGIGVFEPRPSLATQVQTFAAGGFHSLEVKTDGTVWAWGQNNRGQLGDGTSTGRTSPVQVVGLTNVMAVAAGANHSLALLADGTVWAWGVNGNGQLGDGTQGTNRLTPVQVQGLSNICFITTRGNHSLALTTDGVIWAWGQNANGQLGIGSTATTLVPVQVSSLSAVVSVSAGFDHSLAITADGSVWGWGVNSDGRVGDGSTTERTAPVLVNTPAGVTAVSTGSDHSFALLGGDGTVWSWGQNSAGQLGDGTTTQHASPAQVPGLTGVSAIVAGGADGWAIMADGSTKSWGQAVQGQLGDGSGNLNAAGLTPSYYAVLTPTQVSPLGSVAALAVACGGQHTLLLGADGTLMAMGVNTAGQLGDGSVFVSSTSNLLAVHTTNDYVSLACGASFSLARKGDGTVWAWGSNKYQTLGRSGGSQSVPRQVPGVANATGIAAGTNHCLALLGNGTVLSWGNNDSSQLGDGLAPGGVRGVAMPVVDLSDVVGIAAGPGHSLAVKSDGTLWAWGSNAKLQLGYTGPTVSTPRQITELTNVIATAAGNDSSYALIDDGTVWAWGSNTSGQLGDDTLTSRATPAQVVNLSNVLAIAAAGSRCLVLKADGTMWGWGAGTSFPTRAPLSNVSTIGVTSLGACAIRTDGTTWKWGQSDETAVLVTSMSHFVGIGGGGGTNHTLFFMDDSCDVPPPSGVQASPPITSCTGDPVQLSAVPGSGGDNIEWLCDICPNSPVGSGTSLTVNPPLTTTYYARTKQTSTGCTSNLCVPVTIVVNSSPIPVAAVSRRTHGSVGTFDVTVFPPSYAPRGGSEPRRGGFQTLTVTFDEPISAIDGLDESDVSLSVGAITGLSVAGNQLTLEITGVPDRQSTLVSFPGIVGACGRPTNHPLCVGAFEGDANNDGTTNIFDLVTLRGYMNTIVDSASRARADIIPDGVINIFDLVATRNNLNRNVPPCP